MAALKHASQRRRRNIPVGARVLHPLVPGDLERPALPEWGDWHPATVAWWEETWESPMAAEYDRADLPRLHILAELYNFYWRCQTDPNAKAKLASEIRLQSQCFGLSPLDRRRLMWEIDRGEQAAERSEERQATATRRRDPRKAEPLADVG